MLKISLDPLTRGHVVLEVLPDDHAFSFALLLNGKALANNHASNHAAALGLAAELVNQHTTQHDAKVTGQAPQLSTGRQLEEPPFPPLVSHEPMRLLTEPPNVWYNDCIISALATGGLGEKVAKRSGDASLLDYGRRLNIITSETAGKSVSGMNLQDHFDQEAAYGAAASSRRETYFLAGRLGTDGDLMDVTRKG